MSVVKKFIDIYSCIRIHTNIDLTKVRFNSVQYNIRDLESKIYVPERNRLIVDTWAQYVRDKRTVVFCASVKHAEQIAELFREQGVRAAAVSGGMKQSERKEFQDKFVSKEIQVLCACDLLNEGWDCPETEVLFMARPTMSKVLYTQQLGRGMRLFDGKESLMVFDFVDNASQYNMPYSLHRLFRLKDYKPGQLAVAPQGKKAAEDDLYAKGEKPEALIDWPVDATDYELVDIFNWQEEAAGMISQMEFVRRVDVQTETIERYVREGKLIPDLVVPMSEHRTFKYFKEESLERYAEQFGWTLIDDSNRKEMFMEMIRQMDMSYSYKPVLIKAMLLYADDKGRVKLDDVVTFFRSYYEGRRSSGLIVEKKNSIFAKGGYTNGEAARNILSNPFKRFEDMQMILSILRVCPQTRETNILYRLREEFPDFECRKTTFYKYMRKLREQTGFVQFTGRVTSLREESPPGYEAQVDFGQYRMKDMYSKPVRVYFFCMVLAYSRMHYVYFSREPFTTQTAIQAHEFAFQFFGGRTQMIMYDQDRVFVVDENFGNILLVPKFEEYVKKVGFSVRLCRPHDPQSKGKVETFVRYIKESFLAGRIYKGIDSLNSDALRWLDAEGNGTTNLRTRKPPRVMFREEAQHLTRVQFSDEGFSEIRSVSDKYTVKIDWSVYELPRAAVKPFEQVRVEEQDGMLLFYKAAENELIHKCPRRESPGGTTSYEGNSRKGDSVASNSFRLRFEAYDVAERFAEIVEEMEPRYKNLQLGRMLTLSNVFTMEQMVEAMDYCVSIGICSAAEVTAYLIYRHGKDYVTKRISKNAYYRNRERAEEIRREQDGRYR